MKKNLLLLSLCAACAIPAATAKEELTVAVNQTNIYRIDASTGEKTEADPASFFALIETKSEPVVSLECVNMGTGSQPNMNNMAINGDWYNLYSGNGSTLVADYQLSVTEGYVIRNVSVTLVSIDNIVYDWEIAGETFTPAATGTEVSVDCDDQMVHIYADNGDVKPTQFVNFVVTVAQEGEEEEEGGDTPSTPDLPSIYNVLGTFTVEYQKLEANAWSKVTANDVTITRVEGNEVEISGNIFSFIPELDPIPATYNPEDNTLTIKFGDITTGQNWTIEGECDWGDGDDEWEEITEIVYNVDEDGNIISPDEDPYEYYWLVFNPATTWLDYAMYGVNFYLVERAGVNGIEVDANAPVVYYDLQGRKINNPSNGLFIRLQGNKASKVIIK